MQTPVIMHITLDLSSVLHIAYEIYQSLVLHTSTSSTPNIYQPHSPNASTCINNIGASLFSFISFAFKPQKIAVTYANC